MNSKLTKKDMPETMYRASRFCRTLGNPTAYLLLKVLGKNSKTPSEISRDCQLPIQTVSRILRDLRLIESVRYETKGNQKIYWIKDQGILSILDSLENWVNKERTRKT